MKVWKGYGTEHSANLVIVGTFKTVNDATQASKIIMELTDIVRQDEEDGFIRAGNIPAKFSERIMSFVERTDFAMMNHEDPEALLYDFDITQDGNKISIHTEEQKYQIILNMMLSKGAKIEIFSAHDYPSKYSR
jgi:hypothetical protein